MFCYTATPIIPTTIILFRYPASLLSWRKGGLSLWLLHHLCLLLSESLTDSLRASHKLGDAARDTSGLAGDQGLGGEVIDAGVEAAVDETGEHLRYCQWLILGWDKVSGAEIRGMHTPMNSFICFCCMRCSNWRCSLALSPSLNICRQHLCLLRHRQCAKVGALK